MMIRKISAISTLLLGLLPIQAQEQWNSSRIFHEIQKLPVQTTVLYVAAHPDDENTRMISWLANDLKCRTAYLSLTRGDGGQNLIGTELGVELGIIRTHELGEARKIDGGEQYFTRAYDFGYSKSPEETLTKWQRDSILSDIVYVIRYLQPDIIISRFPSGNYPTHGHHTTSAILIEEAFEMAANPNVFPEQLQNGIKPWQAANLYFNASTWWNPKLPELAKTTDSFYVVDVGGFNPVLGTSYSEIAGRSRSMHKSQGFGSSEPIGTMPEYLRITKGRFPKGRNPFGEMVSLTQDKEFDKLFSKISKSYDFQNPEKSLTDLVNLYNWVKQKEKTVPSPLWKYKKSQLEKIIWQCSGLSVKILAAKQEFTQGENILVELKATNRSKANIKLKEIVQGTHTSFSNADLNAKLEYNVIFSGKQEIQLSAGWYSQAPWLSGGVGETMFNNSWRDGGTLPGTDPQYTCVINVEIEGQLISYPVTIEYEYVDPVKGEIRQEILVNPLVQMSFDKPMLLFTGSEQLPLEARIISGKNISSSIISQVSGGFSFQRSRLDEVNLPGDSVFTSKFMVQADLDVADGNFNIRLPQTYAQIHRIAYDHIGVRHHAFQPQVKLTKLDLKKSSRKIAYLQGAGDEVDKYLKLAGFNIETITLSQVNTTELAKYDVLILGIRAYNTLEITNVHNEAIRAFIYNGGNVIMQYNTNRGLKNEKLGPYPFKLGRERVTEENAAMSFINPKHPLITTPNLLMPRDFENWVQERGLYFVQEADSSYEKIFFCHDTGEKDLDGALIVTRYGKGSFIYTGISFFRQLPAGVPGAYRLMGNLIDYGTVK